MKGIGNLIDLLSEMAEKGETIASRTGEIRGLQEGLRGVYGINVRTGLGGIPEVGQFGNIRATEQGPVVDEVREPLVDVFDEGDAVLMVAELPGVAESDVQIEVREDVLSLSTAAGRKYATEVRLPSRVDPATMKTVYKNGILEVRFRKMGPTSAKG